MKIMHVVSARQLRGAEVFALQLAQCFEGLGHQVLMVGLYTYDTPRLPTGSIRFLDLNCKKKGFSVQAASRLNSVICEFKPDIIQANAGDTLKYTVVSRALYRWSGPIVFRNASMVSLYLKSPLSRLFNNLLYRNVDAIASVTAATMHDLVGLFPHVKGKISVIPIGIVPEKIQAVARKPFQIIHIGGFSFEKNHSGLLRIFNSVRRKVPGATLVLVGDGPLRSSIEQEVRDLGLSDCVEFKGAVANPVPHLLESSVLVLPSIIEGLPGVILEAFYYKTPVVAYDVGGIGDIVQNDVTGKLITKGDEEGFAEAVSTVLGQQPESYMAVTGSAHHKVVENYTVERMANAFLTLYTKLLFKKKP